MIMRRLACLVAPVVGLAFVAGLAPAQAAGPVKPVPPAVAAPAWSIPHASTRMDPGAVVGLQRSARGARVVAVFARGGHPVVRVWNESTRSKAVARVAAAQKNLTLVAIETETRQQYLDPVRTARISNDTLRPQQWALDRLQAEAAWTRSRGANITVAVIDTGVAAHPDLGGSFVAGKDFASGGDGRNDGHGHGTHVAGIIAATPDNALGVAGLAPDVAIMPIKVLDDSGSGYSSAVSNGIIWATDRGADIISLSLGGGYDSGQGVAVAYAISRGVTVIAAAGNSRSSGSPVSYPGAFPGVLAVSATQSDNLIASYSNRGDYVDIAAPGTAIYSTLPSGYASWSGTSMATPYVSAAAALVLSRARALSVVVNVPDLLLSTADDLGPAGVDQDFGAGLVDPVGALDALGSGETTLPTPTAVTATARTANRVDVAWQEPTPTTGVTSYQVTATPGGVTCTSAVGTATCALTGLTASSTYSVSVRAIGSVTSSPPSTAVSVTTLARFDAAGDTFETATAIPAAELDEYIDVASDIDWWTTTLATSGTLTVTISNLPGDYDLHVYNDLNELVAWSINGSQNNDSITYAAAAGRYYIRVSPYGGAFSETQAYHLAVEFIPTFVPPPPPPPPPTPEPTDLGGDTQGTATALEPGTVSDYITVNDQDYYTFSVDSTYDIVLNLSELPADFDIRLLHANATVLASGVRAGTQSESIAIQLTAGTYYVHVFGYSGAYSDTVPYVLEFAASRVTPPDLGGNTFETATPMGPSLAADDRIDTATDVDFWSFNVEALSRADVYLTQLNANLDLALFRADGTVVGRSNKAGNTDELTSAWLFPGTYVVRVRSSAREVSNYPYHVAVFLRPLGRAVLDQASDAVSTATPWNLADVNELLHSASDRDFWAFSVATTSRVTMTLSNLPAGYDLALLRSDGRLIARSTPFGNAEISARIPAGRYVVRVSARARVWSEDDYRLEASVVVASAVGPRVSRSGISSGSATDSTLRVSRMSATDVLAKPIMSVKFSGIAGQTRLISGQLVAVQASTRIFVGIELSCSSHMGDLEVGFVSGRNVWSGLNASPIFGAYLISIDRTGPWRCDLRPFVCTPPQCNGDPDVGTVDFVSGADSAGKSSYLTVGAALDARSSQKAMPPASMAAVSGGALLVPGGSTASLSTTIKSIPSTPFTLTYMQNITNCIVPNYPAECSGAPSMSDTAHTTLMPALSITQVAKRPNARCSVVTATAAQGARSTKVTWQEHHALLTIVVPNIELSNAAGCSSAIKVTVRVRVSPGNSMTFERLTSAAPAGLVFAYASTP